MSDPAKETLRHLEDWIRGSGEGELGHVLLTGARAERKRLEKLLSNGGLFPHVDHETTTMIEKLKQTELLAQQKIERCERRQATIASLERQL